MVGLRQLLQSHGCSEDDPPAVTARSSDEGLMMMFFQKSTGEPDHVQPQELAQDQATLEPQAEELQDAVAVNPSDVADQSFDTLVSRFHQLENQMAERAERAKAESRTVEEMKQLAVGMKFRAERTDRDLDAIKKSSAAAEVRATTAEARQLILQEALDVAKRQSAAAEEIVTEFERVIAAFREGKQVQRRTATCSKCGMTAEVSHRPGGQPNVTVPLDRMREFCVANHPSFQKDCKYLQQAILATLTPGDTQASLIAAFASPPADPRS